MDARNLLAEQFEANRFHLRTVAYRMLGSMSEADDAVQEGWLRLNRSDAGSIENLGGWLTTVVARVCLDMLRSRKARREESLDTSAPGSIADRAAGGDPEQEAVLADAVGLALLVVLDTLSPAERLAFVLHDTFGLPFDEIAPIVDRSPAAARQLASRARRRVQGREVAQRGDMRRQREVVDAFLAAARRSDFEALLAILAPDVVLRMDHAVAPAGAATAVRGAEEVARNAARGGARAAQPALVDGALGGVVAPLGRLLMVLYYTVRDGKIVEIEAVGDPERLSRLDLAVFSD